MSQRRIAGCPVNLEYAQPMLRVGVLIVTKTSLARAGVAKAASPTTSAAAWARRARGTGPECIGRYATPRTRTGFDVAFVAPVALLAQTRQAISLPVSAVRSLRERSSAPPNTLPFRSHR
jgi:hypothetical protein